MTHNVRTVPVYLCQVLLSTRTKSKGMRKFLEREKQIHKICGRSRYDTKQKTATKRNSPKKQKHRKEKKSAQRKVLYLNKKGLLNFIFPKTKCSYSLLLNHPLPPILVFRAFSSLQNQKKERYHLYFYYLFYFVTILFSLFCRHHHSISQSNDSREIFPIV